MGGFESRGAARRAGAVLLPWLCIGLGSCYSWRSTQVEFDSIAGYVEKEAAEPEELTWRDRAMRLPWFYRQFESTLVTEFAEATGVERSWTQVGSPAAFASDRILWLAELAGDDLLRMGESCWRLLLVLDRDPAGLHRIYAAQGLGLLLETFATIDPDESAPGLVRPEHEGLFPGNPADYREAARGLVPQIEASWPGRRDDKLLAQGGREAFAQAVDALAKLRTGELQQERLRLRLLLEAVRSEPFRPLQERLGASLVYALQVACVRGLHAALTDDEGAVRVAGLETLLRLGGPELLPRLLAILESRPEVLATAGLRSDPDPLMRRALGLHYWAADAALAEERWQDGRNGLEFLHEVWISDPEPSLRILAADALAWLLRREADPFGAWIPDWWRTYTEGREASSSGTMP